MRTGVPIRRSRHGRMVVRLLVIAAALVGLFAMHGLSDHGAASHDMAPMNPAVTAMGHTGHMMGDSGEATEGARTTAGDPGEGSPGMAMAGLCLAVLAGAVIAFLALRPHRSVALLMPLAWSFGPARLSGRRDRDPPCVFQLSVLRT